MLKTNTADVEAMQIGATPVLRAWAGLRLVHVRPPRPRINAFSYQVRGDSALLSWDASSATPVLDQSITRTNPDGARTVADLPPETREINAAVATVGVTAWDLAVRNAEGETTQRLTETVNHAPTVAVTFAGFRVGRFPSESSALWDVSWSPGYPAPASTLLLTGPGHLTITTLDTWIQRGQTSHRVVAIRGGGAGGTSTLRATLANAAGSAAAEATSGAW